MYHIAIDVMHHVHIFLDALYIYEYIYLRMVLALALVLALVCMNDWCTIVIEGYLKCNFIFCAHRVHANSNSEIFHIL